MSKWIIWTEKQKQIMADWLAARPESIRTMVETHNLELDSLYRLKTTGQRVILYSLSENGTVTVSVLEKYNPERMPPFGGFLDRNVFGINPADLEPCDLPDGAVPDNGADVEGGDEEDE